MILLEDYPDGTGKGRHEPNSHDEYIELIGEFFYCKICQWKWHKDDD